MMQLGINSELLVGSNGGGIDRHTVGFPTKYLGSDHLPPSSGMWKLEGSGTRTRYKYHSSSTCSVKDAILMI